MDPADFYSGIVVDAYAKLKSSRFDPTPYAEFIREHGEPALELGCGDGEPMLDLCAAGLQVDGVDSSLDMVERCRQEASRRGLVVEVHQQRVENLVLDLRYASIYFAGPTFNLLADDETALRGLRSISRHLTDDGAALIPLWIPDPTPPEELGMTRSTDDLAGTELRYTPVSETYDQERRTRTTTCRYERITTFGTEVADRQWVIHWHTPSSFRRLCEQVGLEIAGLVDDDTGTSPTGATSSFTALVRAQRRPATLQDGDAGAFVAAAQALQRRSQS